jgi:hypothetical protein
MRRWQLLERERRRPLDLAEANLALSGVGTMARLRLRFLRWLIAGGGLTEFP